MAKEQVNDMFNKAKDTLNDIDSLLPQDRDHFKNRLDGIHGSINTVLTQDAQADASYENIANQMNHDIDMTRQAIDQLMQQALYTVKSSANRDIEAEYKGAVAQNQKYFGDSAWIYATNSEHDKYKYISGNSYDEVSNNRLTGIREIAKAAVSDAATNAKKKIDNNKVKHENGDNYTDDEKAVIKTEIDRILADAQEKINQNNTLTDIDGKRDDGIETINKASSDSTVIDKIIKDSANSNNNGNNDNSNSNGNGSVSSIPTNPADPAKQPTTDKENGTNGTPNDLGESTNVTLMHNAYLYDEDGKRANKVTLGAGSTITTYGTKTINGKEYYILVDQGANNKKYYVAATNGQATAQKVKHNSYVYNQVGKRVKKSGVFKKGKTVNTYGAAVKIRGKKYFTIGKNRNIKAANVAPVTAAQTAKEEVTATSSNTSTPATTTVVKKLMHNAYLYDENGQRANKLIINSGSEIETIGKKTVKGKTYYALADGLLIDSGNVDAKKLKLKHNAYIYSKYGHRLGKKVLKKHKVVKTYGNPVKIGHKKFYVVASGKYVKKANF